LNKSQIYQCKLLAAWQLYAAAGYPADEMIEADGFIVWSAKRFPGPFEVLSQQIQEATEETLSSLKLGGHSK